ncbi:uridine phosphorylase [Hoeflea poritis]|uniref:Uridine phosphorylase n=1 Tax=Hoeflea poritis TaxID=2993659 RepID=A0ABT4VJX9_9HYPH|nr:uridine phosphorylase [Hoeflea poritis]MDA4845023.1 uridine phosphorylase [Hoeflea poritis]
MKKAWYLGYSADDIGDRAILIGDPDRVDRIAGLLEEPRFLPVSRGLKSVTGGFAGKSLTIAAFGMGAPIATIVLHELADLGISRFLRIGTAMYFPPARGGEFIVSTSAVGFEGTSPAYLEGGEPYAADTALVEALNQAAAAAGQSVRKGIYATYDAFYRDMFGIDDAGRDRASANRELLKEMGVLAVDMETSALLAAAGALDVACTTLCLGTVDALTQEKLEPGALAQGEKQLFEIALSGLCALD